MSRDTKQLAAIKATLRVAMVTACLLVGWVWPATAQGIVEGRVTDAQNGEPLPGVSVAIQGTTIGAATATDGTYEIQAVPEGEHVLRATFVGFSAQEKTVQVQAGEVSEVYFEMESDPLGLDEVVVTGTGGAVEKGKLGNTISTLNASDLENNPVQSVSELLQGREPGVSGLPGGGMTGQGSEIRIRGSASLSQSNEPVIYVDGIRMNSGGGFGGLVSAGPGGNTSRLDDINPESIERVEILKGAAAATLYGSEASNGVIQIFTKRGNPNMDDGLQFDFSIEQGFAQFPTGRVRNQYGFGVTQAQLDNMESYARIDQTDIRRFEIVSQNAVTDMFETGRLQTYTGSVQGGSDIITYYAGGRLSMEDGPLGTPAGLTSRATDEITRGQANVNLNIFPTNNSQIRVSTAYNQMNFTTYGNSNNIYAPTTMAFSSNPRDATELLEYGQTTFASVEEALHQSYAQEVERFTGSMNFNYRPVQMLTLDAVFGADFTSNFSEEERPFGWNVDGLTGNNTEGQRAVANTRDLQLSFDTKAILSNEFADSFESTFTVGGQGFITRTTVTSTDGAAFPGPGFNIVSAASQITPLEEFSEVVQLGVFGQEQIGYKDFLFATIGGRLDANSAFGSSFDAVFYPKVSFSFIPSDLAFWGGSVGPISSFRLRGAIGQSGLQPGAFDAITTFGSIVSDEAGVIADNLGQAELKPEIATEWEAGAEVGMFQNRLSIDATYWNRTTQDALVQRQFPVTGGFRSRQLVNIGATKGQGVEIGLNMAVLNRENVSLDFFANGAYLWEQVTDLGDSPPIKAGGSYPRPRNYIVEGYAAGAHFGAALMDVPDGFLPVDFDGDGQPDSVVQYLGTLRESDGGPLDPALPLTTDIVLLEQEGGNPDISAPLNHYKGKPFPDWNGSFGVDVTFLENFSVSTMFEYKVGNFYVNNLSGAFAGRSAGLGRNSEGAALADRDFITGGVDENFNPQNSGEVRTQALEMWLYDELGLDPFSGLNYIEKADFIRWRELSITYDLPDGLASRMRANDVSLTLAGRNLKLWTPTGYSGLDPEANETSVGGAGNNIDQNFRTGIEAWQMPVQRRITLRLRASF